MIHLPHGFKGVRLAEMLTYFGASAPSLGRELMMHLGLPPEDSAEKITVLEAKGLIQFAITKTSDYPHGVPAVFIDRKEAFPDADLSAFAGKVVSFFDVEGSFDTATGSIASAKVPQRVISNQFVCDFCSDPDPKNREHIPSFMMPAVNQQSIGDWATCDTCHQLIVENRRKDLLNRSLTKLVLGKVTAPALRALHLKFWEVLDASKRPPLPPSKVPHWHEALERKFQALKELSLFKDAGVDKNQYWDLKEDQDALLASDVYSFNAETMHAIMTGAKSIPHESSLKSIELPVAKAGWFWFGEPMPVKCSPAASDVTNALLWAWDTNMKTPTIRFSAYVVDKRGLPGHMFPSTKWFWPIEASYHEMLALNAKWYREVYTPERQAQLGPETLTGEKLTLEVVASLSLFFMMSMLWFRQTVPGTKKKIESKLTQEPGHVERHARKRIQKEFKLDEAPVVKVIALRKSQVTAEPHEPSDENKRHLTVRFVVSGHARLQPYGPGRKERKLIWIDAHVKGDPNAPFKESATKIFAVVR